LPNLSVVAEDPTTLWRTITVANWYGNAPRTVEIVSDTAVWHSTGLPAVPLRWVLIRDPGEAGEFKTQALLCTDLQATPEQIITYFVRRWQMETTFQEVRQRLGFETQRHWSERAIQRTAPALLALFSVVTLLAHQHMAEGGTGVVRLTAWYCKSYPTFSDALAVVRKELWTQEQATFCGSPQETDTVRHGKSPTRVCGTANRRCLLCGVMAKVELGDEQGGEVGGAEGVGGRGIVAQGAFDLIRISFPRFQTF
jgi:hypothetical protein